MGMDLKTTNNSRLLDAFMDTWSSLQQQQNRMSSSVLASLAGDTIKKARSWLSLSGSVNDEACGKQTPTDGPTQTDDKGSESDSSGHGSGLSARPLCVKIDVFAAGASESSCPDDLVAADDSSSPTVRLSLDIRDSTFGLPAEQTVQTAVDKEDVLSGITEEMFFAGKVGPFFPKCLLTHCFVGEKVLKAWFLEKQRCFSLDFPNEAKVPKKVKRSGSALLWLFTKPAPEEYNERLLGPSPRAGTLRSVFCP